MCTTCFKGKNFWILLTVSSYFSNVSDLVMEKCFDYRMGTQCLGAFEKRRKATISFVMSVRPSAWNNSAPARQIFIKIVEYLRISVEKIQVQLISDNNKGYFALRSMCMISRPVLLRMRNVPDQRFRKKSKHVLCL